jgi:hypothetical protein
MVFLVQIAQRHCVGEQLVERISAGAPHVLTKADRHRIDRSEFVDDVVSPALPIPAFSDSLQSHSAFSNERIPRPTRAAGGVAAMTHRIFASLNGAALTVINSQQRVLGSRSLP